jgi:hypothetical protein
MPRERAQAASTPIRLLSILPEKDKQRRAVDAYLKGHEDQPYQYRGLDVYGARCALLHAFGSEGDYHQQCPDAKKFGYHDGGKHAYEERCQHLWKPTSTRARNSGSALQASQKAPTAVHRSEMKLCR